MSDNYAVQGFVVDSFTVKGNVVKVVLKGEKDDIRAGAEDIGGVVTSLEICATAGEDAPINCTLLSSALETTTYQHPFNVIFFNNSNMINLTFSFSLCASLISSN